VKGLSTVIGALHDKLVSGRRVRILSEHLCEFLPPNAHVLDVGCGNGTIDALIQQRRPGISIEGIDVLVHRSPYITVHRFDGITIPYQSQSFDVVMFVDVLHHTDDPLVLLREAARVGKTIVIKDHFCDGFLARFTLRVMDTVGNACQGILPYNYWSNREWTEAFTSLGMETEALKTSLGLYPFPASWLFGRGLHFVAKLRDRKRSVLST
jgi:ubiquinone/menaquinone biosynthesis C-methylase UbiE